MSANIDSMLYVGEKPWHGLGVHYESVPTTAKEIIEGAKLDWKVSATPMKTEEHGEVLGYKAIYREDNNDILGVVNSRRVRIVQNSDTFNTFDRMMGKSVDFDTAASLGLGETVFGCFKIKEGYKVLDDDIDHYFVVMNDHLRPDGKVTVLNTPIRVVCQNTLSAALNNNLYKLRIPVTEDVGINLELMNSLLGSVDSAISNLSKRCEGMYQKKISREDLDKILDELFPYVKASSDSSYSKQNERTEMARGTFLGCMGADNLGNYRGTALQVFNAVLDYEQHYFKNVDKGYDLAYRMSTLPGVGSSESTALSTKALRSIARIAA